MPLFVCDNCQCVENTALGHYWSRNHLMYSEELLGKALCSACTPSQFIDGTVNRVKNLGQWHGKFDKVHFKEYLLKYPDCKLLNTPSVSQ